MIKTSGLHRATVAEIHLDAFKKNIQWVRSQLSSGTEIMAVVKADGYGHGAVPCAKMAVEAGAEMLGVGILAEGMELRENGISHPIQVLCSVFPDEIDELIHFDLSTTLFTQKLADQLSARAKSLNKQAHVHIKVDTGMGRLGQGPEKTTDLIEHVLSKKNLVLDSVFTHLASADDPDPEYTRHQLSRFNQTIAELKSKRISIPVCHAANSSALLSHPESHYQRVRPGIILYGALPSGKLKTRLQAQDKLGTTDGLRPVMHWKTRILGLNHIARNSPLSYGGTFRTERDSLIATLPVGYGDGLMRSLSGKMEVLIGGKRYPQVGTICMDLCLIDVTEYQDVKEGEEVVLFGSQDNAEIKIEEMADHANTLPYEIMCGVGKRVPRIYLPDATQGQSPA